MSYESSNKINEAVANSSFAATAAPKALRITCYGSSSSATPEKYLDAARSVGFLLAKRGHTCVNGGGSYGCMAAMNEGASIGNGHIVGVIHEMFIVDGADWEVRDGGAHKVFHKPNKDGAGPTREMLVAGGDDLQERKKLLVDGADGLIVLPGGIGTWDELWEMACARNIGLTNVSIVVVNVDHYYDNFQQMLQVAFRDKLIKLKPEEIVHFVATAEEGVRWLEEQVLNKKDDIPQQPKIKKRASNLKRSSFMSMDYFRRKTSKTSSSKMSFNEEGYVEDGEGIRFPDWTIPLCTGIMLGAGIASLVSMRR